MCSDVEQMKQAVIPQSWWYKSSSGPEEAVQTLVQYRKFLSWLNVSLNAKTGSKQRKLFIRHFYC